MSETTNLKLNKHDNVSTNTNQFDIDNYLNANWDKIDETVGENKIKIEKLQIENERLRQDLNGLPKGTAEGENIDLTDSADMRFSSFEISGNSKQETRSGKNKLKIKNFENKTIEGVTVTAKYGDNGELQYINATGNSTTNYLDFYRADISNLPAGNYIVNGLGTNQIIRFVLLKKNDTEAKVITKDTDVSFTQDSTSPYTTFRIDLCGTGEINVKMKPMIRLASITDSSYEPYGASPSIEYSSEIKACGDNVNILPIKQFSNQTHKGLLLNSNSDGSIVINGTTTESTTITISKNAFNISADTYGFSVGDAKVSGFSVFLQKSDYTNVALLDMGSISTAIKKLDAMSILSVNIYINSGTKFDNYVLKPKLEKKKNTSYSPSGQGCINEVIENEDKTQSQSFTIPTQQPMRSVEDIRDTFIMGNGKRYERHNINRYVFTGEENITYYSPLTIFFIDINGKQGGINNFLSNYFKVVSTNDYTNMNNGTATGATDSNRIHFKMAEYTTAESFKDWLKERYNSGTPVYVDYILETPIDIECTEEQTAILDEIENTVKSYKGVTHIYSTDNVGPNIKVTYFKDIDIMINKLNTAIVALGGV